MSVSQAPNLFMLLFKRIVHSKSKFHPFQQQRQQLLTHMPMEAVVTFSIFHPMKKKHQTDGKHQIHTVCVVAFVPTVDILGKTLALMSQLGDKSAHRVFKTLG